ncbi:fat storage-inducing transmembrane protein 1 [Betta splendens]|uniref:Fat storage-inducing transmembrane protein 1 homolog n=1 Tax=Betta splendens TaxID=158456 RepID=A0A6P7M9T9_BETSP|nr:fat storage-inducing transmembrane protein 1 [Betta splendens]
MKVGTENFSGSDVNMEKLYKVSVRLIQPWKTVLWLLDAALDFGTDLLARLLGSRLVRRHFHLLLSALVLFGPLLSFWVSRYNVFANSNHYVYRKFLRSTWGWTCVLTASFILLRSLAARHPPSLTLRHLSRVAVVGLLWQGGQRLLTLLEDAAGACYEPLSPQDAEGAAAAGQLPLLLHEDWTKASCLRAKLVWRGYDVSQDVLVLCLCCLLLVEELSVFHPHLGQVKPPHGSQGLPLRLVFLLCALLLALWVFLLLCLLAHFPKFPAQQLGGALGYLGWRGLYQGWYRFRSSWGCPGLPSDGLFTSADANKEPR